MNSEKQKKFVERYGHKWYLRDFDYLPEPLEYSHYDISDRYMKVLKEGETAIIFDTLEDATKASNTVRTSLGLSMIINDYGEKVEKQHFNPRKVYTDKNGNLLTILGDSAQKTPNDFLYCVVRKDGYNWELKKVPPQDINWDEWYISPRNLSKQAPSLPKIYEPCNKHISRKAFLDRMEVVFSGICGSNPVKVAEDKIATAKKVFCELYTDIMMRHIGEELFKDKESGTTGNICNGGDEDVKYDCSIEIDGEKMALELTQTVRNEKTEEIISKISSKIVW